MGVKFGLLTDLQCVFENKYYGHHQNYEKSKMVKNITRLALRNLQSGLKSQNV
jgi:hypothetical protein